MISWKVLYIAFLNEESSYSTFQLLLYDFLKVQSYLWKQRKKNNARQECCAQETQQEGFCIKKANFVS